MKSVFNKNNKVTVLCEHIKHTNNNNLTMYRLDKNKYYYNLYHYVEFIYSDYSGGIKYDSKL